MCRELTKTHEQVLRGTLAELAAWAQDGVRGEVTLVLAGAPEAEVETTPAELVRLVGVREQAGLTRKEAHRRGGFRDRAAAPGRVRRGGRRQARRLSPPGPATRLPACPATS